MSNSNSSPKNKSGLVQDILKIFRSKIFIVIAEFTSNVIITRQLGPEGKGIYSSLLIFPAIVISFADLGIQKSIVYYIAKNKSERKEVISTVFFLMILSSGVAILICSLAYLFFGNINFTLIMVLMSLTLIPLRIINSYTSGIFLGQNKLNFFNRIQSVPFVLKFVFIIIFVLIFKGNIHGAVASNLLASSITCAWMLWALSGELEGFKVSYIPTIIKPLISLGIIYAITLFILNLNYKIDIILLEKLSNASEIGQYTTGVSIAELVWQLPMTLEIIIFSRSANSQNSSDFSLKVSQLMRLTLIISVFVGIALIIVAPTLLPMLYGQDFKSSARVLQLLMPGIIAFNIVKVLYTDIAGQGYSINTWIIFIPSLLINIFLNLFLIPIYGANGSALASTFSYTLAAVGCLIIYSKITNIELSKLISPKKNDFDFLHKIFNTSKFKT